MPETRVLAQHWLSGGIARVTIHFALVYACVIAITQVVYVETPQVLIITEAHRRRRRWTPRYVDIAINFKIDTDTSVENADMISADSVNILVPYSSIYTTRRYRGVARLEMTNMYA